MTAPARPPLVGHGYQRFIAGAWLVAVTLMVTQYAVVKYGPAKVFITPFALSSPDDFGHKPGEQQPGVFVINWDVLDQSFYKLQAGTFLPPAEGLVALLFLVAWPLVIVLRPRRQVWPSVAMFALTGLGLLSCLAAQHFGPALRENLQLILTVLVTTWLAGAAVAEPDQVKRLYRWLGTLTVVLVLLATWDYWRQVMQPGEAANPLAVRATCASRSAFSGLLLMLLCLVFGRVISAGNLVTKGWWLVVVLFGATKLLNAGAVLALAAALAAMVGVKSRGGLLLGLVALPAGVFAAVWFSAPGHVGLLRESLSFYDTTAGRPTGVTKRYLEMAASLTGLRRTQDVTGSEPDAAGSLPVIGRRSNVLLGVGAGLNYQRAIGEFYGNLDNPEKQEPDTYNLYLLLALQMGLCGALVWAWLLLDGAATARGAHDALADPELRAFAVGVYGACVGILIFSVFGTVLVRGVGLMLFTLLGVAGRLAWLSRPEEPPRPPARPEARRPEPASAEGEELPLAAATVLAEAVADDEPLTAEAPAPTPEPTAPIDLDAPAAATEPIDLDAPAGAGEPPDLSEVADPSEPVPDGQDLRAWLRAQGLLEDDEDEPPDSQGEPPRPNAPS